jgi:hypothetical protein
VVEKLALWITKKEKPHQKKNTEKIEKLKIESILYIRHKVIE